MKYTSTSKPLICMQTQSTCYNGTSKMTVKGILWHSTGANNPNLKRYVQPSDTKPSVDTYSKTKWLEVLGTNNNKNDWNHAEKNVGLNGWIGKLADGTVASIQSMPWDFRPWGCGSGSKGSCNDGFIQFEICEDGLTDKDYFNKVYKEACELTAYLCQLYKIDPKGTTTINGVKVPTITCHQDAHKLGLASNHGDINHWFPKYGKDMSTARDDVASLLKPTVKTLYRVRKSKSDAKSQIGAYTSLDGAIKACQEAGEGYKVFDQDWNIAYTYKAPITLSSIAVTKLPSKTTYVIGESFSKTGLEITATYSDKSTKVITGYNISELSTKSAGTVTMTVTFEGKKATFSLTVKEKELTEEQTKPVDPEPDEATGPGNSLDNSSDDKSDIDLTGDLDAEQLDKVSDNLAKLIFECIKKLVQMFANLFNNKGE